MRGVLALLLVAAVSAETFHPYASLWAAWKSKHNKNYETSSEEQWRFSIFLENAAEIAQHNMEHDLGLHTFTLGLNKYADLSQEEFKASILGLPRGPSDENTSYDPRVSSSVPSSIDWRDYGAVTPVKNQGQCGSCWSFGSTGALEGQYFLTNGKLLSFSEQQQVDCNKLCFGCNGGTAEHAFHYWKKTYGAVLESEYSYTGVKGTCHTDDYEPITNVGGYNKITKGSESDLKKAVGSVGPVTVAIDASGLKFQFYNSGIYYRSACSSTELDHQVLVVGYSADPDGKYWIVKNSWGEDWGIEGYIWMARDEDNNCGIASDATYPYF